jgi:hypothetical protein
MNHRTEQLVRDYLNHVSLAARGRLSADDRRALLARMHEFINWQVSSQASATRADLRRLLAGLGDAATVVESERARLAAIRASGVPGGDAGAPALPTGPANGTGVPGSAVGAAPGPNAAAPGSAVGAAAGPDAAAQGAASGAAGEGASSGAAGEGAASGAASRDLAGAIPDRAEGAPGADGHGAVAQDGAVLGADGPPAAAAPARPRALALLGAGSRRAVAAARGTAVLSGAAAMRAGVAVRAANSARPAPLRTARSLSARAAGWHHHANKLAPADALAEPAALAAAAELAAQTPMTGEVRKDSRPLTARLRPGEPLAASPEPATWARQLRARLRSLRARLPRPAAGTPSISMDGTSSQPADQAGFAAADALTAAGDSPAPLVGGPAAPAAGMPPGLAEPAGPAEPGEPGEPGEQPDRWLLPDADAPAASDAARPTWPPAVPPKAVLPPASIGPVPPAVTAGPVASEVPVNPVPPAESSGPEPAPAGVVADHPVPSAPPGLPADRLAGLEAADADRAYPRALAGSRLAGRLRTLAGGLARVAGSTGAAFRTWPLESSAILLLGLGGLIYPPVWLAGAITALLSRRWDRRDKWIGLAVPVLLVIVGSVLVVAVGGHQSSIAGYAREAWMSAAYLSRAAAVLGAAFLAWRVRQGPRRPALPPWHGSYQAR